MAPLLPSTPTAIQTQADTCY